MYVRELNGRRKQTVVTRCDVFKEDSTFVVDKERVIARRILICVFFVQMILSSCFTSDYEFSWIYIES